MFPDANTPMPKKRPRDLVALFWSHVQKDGPIHPYDPALGKCWLWTGEIMKNGYGRLNTRVKGVAFRRLAHRFSYELHKEPMPENEVVRHSCDVPNCVNPDHLLKGSHRDNSQDMVKRDRSMKGEKNPHAFFTEDQAREIHARYANERITHRELAVEYGVTTGAISLLLAGTTWSYLKIDSKVKDRSGSRSGRAKFDEDQIRQIRALCAEGKTPTEVGRIYGSEMWTIRNIVQRVTYKNVD